MSHHHDHADHAHPRRPAATIATVSLLRASAASRLMGAAILLAAVWAAVILAIA
jgi:hypothetical protein